MHLGRQSWRTIAPAHPRLLAIFERARVQEMQFASSLPARQMCILLCMLLALVFTGASTAGIIDKLQHLPGAGVDHEHFVFSDISAEHADVDHQATSTWEDDHDQGSDTNQTGGHHHHHGDSGSGIALTNFGAVFSFFQNRAPLIDFRDRMTQGLMVHGPLRPPRALSHRA